MLNLSQKLKLDLNQKELNRIKSSFYDYLDNNIDVPYSFKAVLFPENFLDQEYYLVIPTLFRKALGYANRGFSIEISISGYFYFKYLLCLDLMADQDVVFKDEKIKEHVMKMNILQGHVYHGEAMKILGKYFGKNDAFWKKWNERNNTFFQSILIDNTYNIGMSMEEYEKLCIGKCSFSNVAIDVFHFKSNNTNTELYEDLEKINDYFAIGRCIQDDIEDFKKDIMFKKNNLAHVYLNTWLKSKNKEFDQYSTADLEKLLIPSQTLEKLLSLSNSYFQKAILICEKYGNLLDDYKKILKNISNTLVFFKVQSQAYRLDVIYSKFLKDKKVRGNNLSHAIELSEKYLHSSQSQDGCWYEILNKQGLSNVWSTSFIASFIGDDSPMKIAAQKFIKNSSESNLWGYNTDWSFDYDSSTWALMLLSGENHSDLESFSNWREGQKEDGGISTYMENDTRILNKLNLKKDLVKGWTQSHICVSAVAYYFIVSNNLEKEFNLNGLKEFIFSNKNKNNTWDSYWWSSPIYSTCFIIKAMLIDKNIEIEEIKNSVESLLSLQNKNGSFSCPISKNESAFYSSLVLDTLCADNEIFSQYRSSTKKIKNWLLKNQLQSGNFENTDFLVIPNPFLKKWDSEKVTFMKNKYGAGNSITGEQYGLFTTAIAHSALKKYQQYDN